MTAMIRKPVLYDPETGLEGDGWDYEVEEPVPNIDADLENADWPKRTWDLPFQTEDQLQAWLDATGVTLEQFSRLPVYQARPWRDRTVTAWHWEEPLVAAGFDESKVRRHPRGTPVRGKEGGGRFAEKQLARFDPYAPDVTSEFDLDPLWSEQVSSVHDPTGDLGDVWEGGKHIDDDVYEDHAVRRAVKQHVADVVTARLEETLSPEQLAEVEAWYRACDPEDDWGDSFTTPNGEYWWPNVKDTAVRRAVTLTVANWARTSSDHDPIALAIQEAARQEFGLRGEYDLPKMVVDTGLRDAIPGARHILRAQYDLTQELFERYGIEEVVAFRGVALPHEQTDQWNDVYGIHKVRTNPISSFAYAYRQALPFIAAKGSDTHPAMMAARIPRERILSTPFTGFGCLNELELTVLGGEDEVFVVHRPPPDFPEIPNDSDPNNPFDSAWTYLREEEPFWAAWRRASESGPGPVVSAAWDESRVRRWPEGTPVEGDVGGGRFAPGGLARWEELNAEQQEQKKYYEESWEQDRAGGLGENDFGFDYWRMWADEQGLEMDGNIPTDWMKGWTWGEDAENVDAVIAEAPGISGDIAVWRGVPGGDPGQSDRPLSTSFSKHSALSYADRTGRGNEKNLYRVIIPAGTRVGWDPAEAEVVLPSGTELVDIGPNVRLAKVPPRYVE